MLLFPTTGLQNLAVYPKLFYKVCCHEVKFKGLMLKKFQNNFRWVDQCPNGHDKNRLVPGYPYVGQNMADSWSSANSADKAVETKVQAWYDEVKTNLCCQLII
jgi:hypothetical protein